MVQIPKNRIILKEKNTKSIKSTNKNNPIDKKYKYEYLYR